MHTEYMGEESRPVVEQGMWRIRTDQELREI